LVRGRWYHEHCRLILGKSQEVRGQRHVERLQLLQWEATDDLQQEVGGVEFLAQLNELVLDVVAYQLELSAGGDFRDEGLQAVRALFVPAKLHKIL